MSFCDSGTTLSGNRGMACAQDDVGFSLESVESYGDIRFVTSKMQFKKSNRCNTDNLSRLLYGCTERNCYDGLTVLKELPCGGCKECVQTYEQWCDFENCGDVVLLITRLDLVKCPSVFDSLSWIRVFLMLLWIMCCDLFSRIIQKSWCFPASYRCESPVRRLYKSESQREAAVGISKDNVQVNKSTLEKDMGLLTHAGGLYP